MAKFVTLILASVLFTTCSGKPLHSLIEEESNTPKQKRSVEEDEGIVLSLKDRIKQHEQELKAEFEYNKQVVVEVDGQKAEPDPNAIVKQTDESIVDGSEVSDMILTAEQKAQLESGNREKRRVHSNSNIKWMQNGEDCIPYRFGILDASSNEQTEKEGLITQAIEAFLQHTCLQFCLKEDSGSPHHILFTEGNGCSSYVGRTTFTNQNYQEIRLGGSSTSSCYSMGVLMHEIMHALGQYHEHMRRDRDDYVAVNLNYVASSATNNFDKAWNTVEISEYDLASVMQYNLGAFRSSEAPSGADTITPKSSSLRHLAGQRSYFTHYDLKTINHQYQCKGQCSTTCNNDGYAFYDSSCSCKCPDYFEGSACDDIKTSLGCGGLIDLTLGQSVNISAQASNEARKCVWKITGPVESIPQVHFTSFNLGSICGEHSLEVRYNLLGQQGVELCGMSLPGDVSSLDGDTSANWVMLIYQETESVTSGEFSLTTTARRTDDPCLSSPCNVRATHCSSTPGSTEYTCVCPIGYTGATCNERDFSLPIMVDFETPNSALLMYGNAGNDDFDWTRNSGATGTSSTGPVSGFQNSNSYLFCESSSPREPGDVARYQSVNLPIGENRCLRFAYSMYGASMGTLRVKLEVLGVLQADIWSKTGDQGADWIMKHIDIPAQASPYKIVFEYERGSSYRGDVALDNIETFVGQCVFTTTTVVTTTGAGSTGCSCDFENDDLCDCLEIVNEKWLTLKGPNMKTPSSKTGPTWAASGNGVVFYEASSDPDKEAILKVKYGLSAASSYCLRFSYHMYGEDIVRFSVRAVDTNVDLWKRDGDQGDKWFRERIQMPAGNTQVQFVATSSNYKSDIAIDHLILDQGDCIAEPCDLVPCKHIPEGLCSNTASQGMDHTCANCPFGMTRNCDYIDMAANAEIIADFEGDPSYNPFDFFEHEGNVPMRVQTGETSSSSTGPPGAFHGSKYLYMEASDFAQDAAVVLRSETIKAGSYCLELNYCMYGADMGQLHVDTGATSVWSKNGNQGTGWKTASISLSSPADDFTFSIRAIRGSGSACDIAIDYIKLRNAAC